MMSARSILIIDADPDFRRNAGLYLRAHGYAVHEASDVPSGLEVARENASRFVLVDVAFQNLHGLDLVDQVRDLPHHPDVICVAKGCPVPLVVAAVRAGALEVLDRPVDGDRLLRVMEHALKPVAQPARESSNTHLVVEHEPQVDVDVAESPMTIRALELAARFAPKALLMAVEGEAGAGHEIVARHFHRTGPRSEGPFVVVPAVPIGGISPHDLLFGTEERVSAFARAKGGVVFIESLSSLGTEGQDRLYKLLDGLFTARASGTDIRWPPMAIGLERPLEAEVQSGRVRRDLARMLRARVVTIAPLRERPEDVPPLIERTVEALRREAHLDDVCVAPEVIDDLAHRSWEGNIPELIATVRRAAALDPEGRLVLDLSLPGEPIELKTLPQEATASVRAEPAPEPDPNWHPTLNAAGQVQPYEVYEAEIFRYALHHAGGCVSRAAELLGVGRATMYRKMRTYDIEVPPVSERTMARSRRARQERAEERAARQAAFHHPN